MLATETVARATKWFTSREDTATETDVNKREQFLSRQLQSVLSSDAIVLSLLFDTRSPVQGASATTLLGSIDVRRGVNRSWQRRLVGLRRMPLDVDYCNAVNSLTSRVHVASAKDVIAN